MFGNYAARSNAVRAIFLCIREHFASLSEPCKGAIARAAERRMEAR